MSPAPGGSRQKQGPQALSRLDEITRRLRVECPWDREQDERTIVPHTLEEAYELADAAHRRDDAKMLDELGDVLFQVHFLSLLLEERGSGSLAEVADHCVEKLIRRHPHVFGELEASSSAEVLRNWDQIKRGETGREPGVFGEVPENLPSPLYARKVQRRAASSGFDFSDVGAIVEAVREELAELEAAPIPISVSPSSAICCSPWSIWGASSELTPSWPFAPRPTAFGVEWRPAPRWPRPRAEAGTICPRMSSLPTTPGPV